MTNRATNFDTQTQKAKLKAIKKIVKIVLAEGWHYEDWRYASRIIREKAALYPKRKAQKLPRILSEEHFKGFYSEIEKANNLEHELMLKLLFFSGVRVQELTGIKMTDVYLDENKVFIEQGKGCKDRYVLFNQDFKMALKVYITNHSKNRYLFQTRLHNRYTTRRIQQIVKHYATKAGVDASPHSLRHQMLTWLTKHGFNDAELMLISGHSSKDSLKIYQHLSLGDIQHKYEDAMKKVEF
jgi:site-specific recombinase XerD